MYRSNSYDEYVARRLRNSPKNVQSYLLSLEEARITIQRMGIKEFCEMTGIPTPNVSEFIKGK